MSADTSKGNKGRAGDARQFVERMLEVLGISDWVTYRSVISNTLYLIFLLAIGLLYVGNTHRAEGTIRQINKKEKELKEKRWEYISSKSELMYSRKQSEMADKLKDAGLVELAEPPYKIVVKKGEY